MALEPITRKEKIIAGENLQPITRMEQFLKKFGGSGGGGVQPDWNQNDETQPDYVKNRPFYTGNPVETVLVEESTATFSENSGIYMAEFPTTFEVTVGETYKVSWDGNIYECACVDYSGLNVIGNLSIIGAGSDTGEPFLLLVYNGQSIDIYTADTSASHTFSISGFVPEVIKIDEKYIPTIPADKFPATPVMELAHNISDLIANSTPSFYVSNMGYSEIYSIVKKGSFQIKDPSCVYIPIKYQIDASGNIFVDILISGSPMTYAQLVCNVDQRKFLRNSWWQIEATQK